MNSTCLLMLQAIHHPEKMPKKLAARLLGISRSTLYAKLAEYGIS